MGDGEMTPARLLPGVAFADVVMVELRDASRPQPERALRPVPFEPGSFQLHYRARALRCARGKIISDCQT
jgi:hypothetical protein